MLKLMITLAIILAALGALAFVLKLLEASKKQSAQSEEGPASEGPLPYVPKSLLSGGEAAFFPILQRAVADRSFIFAQIPLSAILKVKPGTQNWQAMHNKIDRKSVDFVLCSPNTYEVRLAIELDDRSHDRDHRRERDGFVDRALQAADVPLLRIKTAKAYSHTEVEAQIRAVLSPAAVARTN